MRLVHTRLSLPVGPPGGVTGAVLYWRHVGGTGGCCTGAIPGAVLYWRHICGAGAGAAWVPVAAAIAGAGVWVLVVGCGAAARVVKLSAPSGRQPSSPAMIEYHP